MAGATNTRLTPQPQGYRLGRGQGCVHDSAVHDAGMCAVGGRSPGPFFGRNFHSETLWSPRPRLSEILNTVPLALWLSREATGFWPRPTGSAGKMTRLQGNV